jgi:ubiquinone/menaquinone biosynthesis C-methylase UbiE
MEFAIGKNVLEIGCGAGIGLGYLARFAKKMVGGDIEEKNIALAKQYYNGRPEISIDLMDAHKLPFPDGSFDLALLYETIYYLRDPEKCISEALRVLREGGILVVCTVNKDWKDFHPSPYTYKYFTVPELYELLRKHSQEVRLFGGFPIKNDGVERKMISLIKKSAVKLKLIPGSLKARAYLKRIFMGRLVPLPSEITEGMTPYEPPIPVAVSQPNRDYKIIYAVARKDQS